MEPLAFAQRVLQWRWTPCVAPVMGSVVIALLTLAVVPDEIQGIGTSSGPIALRSKHGPTTDGAADDGSDGATAPGVTSTAHHPGVGHGRPRMPADAVQGFFHKAQELPVEPVDPTPQAPPAEPPPPPPTATVFTLPDPAPAAAALAAPPTPVEPGALPPPNVPLQPLGPTTGTTTAPP